MKQVNLILALIWVALATFCLAWPEKLPPAFQPLNVQMAVFAGVLAFYNVTRYWMLQLRARYERAEEEPRRRRPRQPSGPIDPTFDLDDDRSERAP